ncbi:MAG: type II toxin-antitoxin system YafQ family toxin [Bacteroidota bacterium]|nr:type II toxin-antitoxin system YafQ family toxin [Bacteroidota bacterium]
MLKPIFTKRFNKDLKRIKKSKSDIEQFKYVSSKLINEEKLELKYRDHKLIGNYIGRRECHIEPDWLLIYKIEDDKIIFERTGTHSELF